MSILFHKNDLGKLLRTLDMGRIVRKGDRVALKLHMGEEGNTTYLKPTLVKEVVEVVKSVGAKPFIIDSPTLYPKKRATASGYREVAKAHGFTSDYLGAEVIIGGGEQGDQFAQARLDRFFELDAIRVIPEIAQADSMILLTHVKGHILAKYGGTLKQLGMGSVSKQTKRDVHIPTRPALNLDYCSGCAACVESCPFEQITINEKISIGNDCTGCGRCIDACPNGVIRQEENYLERFYKRLMDASKGVLKFFEKSGNLKVINLNFLFNIYEFCDCTPNPGRRLAPDIGILASSGYPLAIEMASIDLVRRSNPSAFPAVDEYIKQGEKIGLGEASYSLEEL